MKINNKCYFIAPKRPTNFFARTGSTPFTKPPARYLSTPSLLFGGTAFKTLALNWSPCSLSRTHQPSAVSHSPALTDGYETRTVISSRCPRTFTRSTENPLSSLKKVTLSTSPAISSDGVRGWVEEALILIEVYAVGVNSRACYLIYSQVGNLVVWCNRSREHISPAATAEKGWQAKISTLSGLSFCQPSATQCLRWDAG